RHDAPPARLGLREGSPVRAMPGADRQGTRAMTEPTLVRNILFATDFSRASRLAAESAAAFARHFGARLHVLHVVPPVTDPTPAPAALRAVAAELERGLAVGTAIRAGGVPRHNGCAARGG